MADHDWLSDLKTHLGETQVDASRDAHLNLLLSQVAATVRAYCGRDVIDPGSDVTEYHNGAARGIIAVRRPPILSVTSLHDDSEREWGSASEIESDDYIVTEGPGLIELKKDRIFGSVFGDAVKNVRVIYRPGVAEDSADLIALQLAVFRWVARIYRIADRQLDHVKGESSAAGNLQMFDHTMPKDVEMICGRFRLLDLGDP